MIEDAATNIQKRECRVKLYKILSLFYMFLILIESLIITQ